MGDHSRQETDYTYNNNPQNPFEYINSHDGTDFGMAGTQSLVAAQIYVHLHELSRNDSFLSRLLKDIQHILGSYLRAPI